MPTDGPAFVHRTAMCTVPSDVPVTQGSLVVVEGVGEAENGEWQVASVAPTTLHRRLMLQRADLETGGW
jgi:hypothetical protein